MHSQALKTCTALLCAAAVEKVDLEKLQASRAADYKGMEDYLGHKRNLLTHCQAQETFTTLLCLAGVCGES